MPICTQHRRLIASKSFASCRQLLQVLLGKLSWISTWRLDYLDLFGMSHGSNLRQETHSGWLPFWLLQYMEVSWNGVLQNGGLTMEHPIKIGIPGIPILGNSGGFLSHGSPSHPGPRGGAAFLPQTAPLGQILGAETQWHRSRKPRPVMVFFRKGRKKC